MRWIYLTAVWLHVLAAMTWVGGMVLFVVALMPFFRRQARWLGRLTLVVGVAIVAVAVVLVCAP